MPQKQLINGMDICRCWMVHSHFYQQISSRNGLNKKVSSLPKKNYLNYQNGVLFLFCSLSTQPKNKTLFFKWSRVPKMHDDILKSIDFCRHLFGKAYCNFLWHWCYCLHSCIGTSLLTLEILNVRSKKYKYYSLTSMFVSDNCWICIECLLSTIDTSCKSQYESNK